MRTTIDCRSIVDISAAFDCQRQGMLFSFRQLAAASPEIAAQEVEATLSAMRQLFQMELSQ